MGMSYGGQYMYLGYYSTIFTVSFQTPYFLTILDLKSN